MNAYQRLQAIRRASFRAAAAIPLAQSRAEVAAIERRVRAEMALLREMMPGFGFEWTGPDGAVVRIGKSNFS